MLMLLVGSSEQVGANCQWPWQPNREQWLVVEQNGIRSASDPGLIREGLISK